MKLCLIGCGGHARAAYQPALIRYKAENPSVDYAACCDADIHRAAAFKEDVGFEAAYDHYGRMLSEVMPDAVILVTPYTRTAAIAADVIPHTRAIMIEKPLGDGLTECEAIAAAADAAGTITKAAFNRRHIPLIRALMRALEADGSPVRHIDYKLYRVARREPYFYSTAVHGVDLVGHIAGSEYGEIHFRHQYVPEQGEGAKNIHMQCAFKSGATAALSFCPFSGLVAERLEIVMDDAVYYVGLPIWNGPDTPGYLIKYENGKKVFEKSGAEISDGAEMFESNGFYGEVADFLNAVREGRAPLYDVRSAMDTMRVMDEMRK